MRPGPVLAAALAALSSAPAAAQDGPLATYWENAGSLPPAHAVEFTATIAADGALALRVCRGYRTEGPSCADAAGTVSPAALAAILSAAEASGLARDPAEVLGDTEIPVGGATRGGAVVTGGKTVTLPAFPREADAPRVGAVLDAIAAAIPAALRAAAEARAVAP